MKSEWKPWNGGECPVHPETEVEIVKDGRHEVAPSVDKAMAGFCFWGKDTSIILYRIIKEHEEPKEKTLEERIKEKWPDKVACLLERKESTGSLVFAKSQQFRHFEAVSMPGFAGYIFEGGKDFVMSAFPCLHADGKILSFPVAVIFNKESEQ